MTDRPLPPPIPPPAYGLLENAPGPDGLEELDDGWNRLPRATRRCWDCGVGSGPCQCTREYGLWEAEQEERRA